MLLILAFKNGQVNLSLFFFVHYSMFVMFLINDYSSSGAARE